MAQRLDAQMRRPREVADRERGCSDRSIESPPAGGSNRNLPLDPPARGRRTMESRRQPRRQTQRQQEALMTTLTTDLEGVVAEHVDAVNAFDEDAIVATFADDALVNDAHREFWGTEAIRRWVAKEMVGDKVTIDVTEVIEHHGADDRSCPIRRRVRQDRTSRRADPDQLLHRPRREDRQPDRDPQHAGLLRCGGARRAPLRRGRAGNESEGRKGQLVTPVEHWLAPAGPRGSPWPASRPVWCFSGTAGPARSPAFVPGPAWRRASRP